MWLEHLRIQDIFSSLFPLIEEFYHLCTGWRLGGAQLRRQDFAFSLGTITRSYLDTENRVSYGVFLPVYVSLQRRQFFVHGILTFISPASISLRSIANHKR